jgi:hypothetical protein
MKKKKRKNNKKDEPQLSKEEHQLIFDIALDQAKVTKQKKAIDPLLKQYLSVNKVITQYIRDMNGYPRGIVVATGKNRIGWSLVSSKDISLQRIDPTNIPVLKQLVERERPIEDIIRHKAYQKCIRDHSSVTVPRFNKDTGLLLALGRSLISKLEEKDGKLLLEPAPPHDKELLTAISRMVARSRRYFK